MSEDFDTDAETQDRNTEGGSSDCDQLSGDAPAVPDVPANVAWQRLRATLFGTETRKVGSWTVIAGAVITLVLALVFSTGGNHGQSKPIVINGKTVTTVAQPSVPRDAVEEIAERDIWSSAPVTYPGADEISHYTPDAGEGIALPQEDEYTLTAAPKAVLPTALVEDSHQYENGPVLVVGKITGIQTLGSRFLGERGYAEEDAHGPKPVIQVELAGHHSVNAYVEFTPLATESAPGEVIIALGRLAAVGETRHNTMRSAYFLAKKVETVSSASELDSIRLRELYTLAKSDSSEKTKGGGFFLLP